MKRLIALLGVCAVCVMLGGCCVSMPPKVAPPSVNETVSEVKPTVDVPLVLSENGRVYASLSKEQQENFDEIVKQLYQYRGDDTFVDDKPGITIYLPHALGSEDELHQLFTAVVDEHPAFFYLKTQYSWLESKGEFFNIRFYYLWDAQGRATRGAELESVVQAWLAESEGMSDAEKALFFHDQLIETCEYNQTVVDESKELDTISDERYLANTAYSALCDGNPVCGGYTHAYDLLLDRSGIENVPIVNEDHVWTMLWLDGEAYHVDVTWDDPTEDDENHIFFNLTDDEIRASRDYPAQFYDVPEATAKAYNFYAMTERYFEDAYDESIDECVRMQIEAGNEWVELKFAPDVYAEACMYWVEEQAFFDAVYELEDDALRDTWYTTIVYYTNDDYCTLKIQPDDGE